MVLWFEWDLMNYLVSGKMLGNILGTDKMGVSSLRTHIILQLHQEEPIVSYSLHRPIMSYHTRIRRNLSHGFSNKALRDHEPRIMKYIAFLIERLRGYSKDGPLYISA